MKIAFFDVDKTITKSDTFFCFFLFVYRRYPLKIAALFQVFFFFVFTRVFGANRILVKRAVFKMLNGLEQKSVEELSHTFFETNIRPILREQAIQKMEELRENGYQIILCSASPEIYLHPLAKYLKVELIATNLIVTAQSQYSLGVHCYGDAKVSYIEAYAKEKNLDINYSESFFFSDHHSDLPMMKKVGHAVAVTPNKKLLDFAIKNQWQIVNW